MTEPDEDDALVAELVETVSYAGEVGRWESTPETEASDDEPAPAKGVAP